MKAASLFFDLGLNMPSELSFISYYDYRLVGALLKVQVIKGGKPTQSAKMPATIPRYGDAKVEW